MSSINVQVQSASGRCETVIVSERRNDAQTCNAALSQHLAAKQDPSNTGGWRVLSLGGYA